MTANICYFHDSCADGLLAASIYHAHNPLFSFVPTNYSWNIPLTEKSNVVFVDFCPTPEWTKDNIDNILSLEIFDHHKTSSEYISLIQDIMDNANKPVTFHFDMDRSGGHIVWDHFESEPLSWRAEILTEYDLGHPLGELEGFIDRAALFFDIEDIYVRLGEFYRYITENSQEAITETKDELLLINKLRENKFRWFEKKIKVFDITLPWLAKEGRSPVINVAFTHAPQYMITSFAKWFLEKNPTINLVVGVSVSNATMGLSFRGRSGETYARSLAEKFYGGGHDSAAGGVSWTVCGFYKLKSFMESGIFPIKPNFKR